METIKYKGYAIEKIRNNVYELIHDLDWCTTDLSIENLKKTVDEILMHEHLDWKISYYDIDNNLITSITKKNCAEHQAEQQAIKNKPLNAVNWSVLQMGLFVWQIFNTPKWCPESQNNTVTEN